MRFMINIFIYLLINKMDVNVAILVDAKNEYTTQLQNILRPHLYEGLIAVYNKGKNDIVKSNNVKSSVFKNFQDNLSLIPQWNQDIIETEAMRIRTESKCDWLDDLITAIFVSNVRILTAIKNIKSKQEIKIKVPNYSHFVHSCYYQCAIDFYKNPYLFDDSIRKSEIQSNMRTSLEIINNCIINTIRKLLPIKLILNKYLETSVEEEEILSDSDADATKNLKKYRLKNNDSDIEDEDGDDEGENDGEGDCEDVYEGDRDDENNSSEEEQDNLDLDDHELDNDQGLDQVSDDKQELDHVQESESQEINNNLNIVDNIVDNIMPFSEQNLVTNPELINEQKSVDPELVKELEQEQFVNSTSINEQELVQNPLSVSEYAGIDQNLVQTPELVVDDQEIIDNPVLDLSDEREIKIRTPVPDNEKIHKDIIQQYLNNTRRGVFIRKVKKKKIKKNNTKWRFLNKLKRKIFFLINVI